MADNDLKMKVDLEAQISEKQVKEEVDKIWEITKKELWLKKAKVEFELDAKTLRTQIKEAEKIMQEARKRWEDPIELSIKTDTMRSELRLTEWYIKKIDDEIKQVAQEKIDVVANEVQKIGKNAKESSWYITWLRNEITSMITKFSLVTATITAVKKWFDYLKDTFNNFQEAQKKIVQMTWATWEALQKLTKDMLAVQGEVNQTQWEVAEAVWELNTRLGLTWKELQDFTTTYLKFAYATWQDWKTAISENIKLFNQRGVSTENQASYLDKLTLAWQKTWISVSDLTSNLQENAIILKEMGFNLDESIALLSNFEKAWVDASSVLQSMKIWLKSLVDDWKAPNEALWEVIDKIKNAKTASEWLNIAFEVFWARWGSAMYNAIKSWTLELDDMIQALDEANWTVEKTTEAMETLGEYISRKWNKIVAESTDLVNTAFQSTRKRYNDWENAITRLIKWEADLKIQGDQLVVVMNEEWVKADILAKKQAQLNEVYEKWYDKIFNVKAVQNELNSKTQQYIKAVEELNRKKLDTSASREDIIATSNKVMELYKQIQNLKAELQWQSMVSSAYINNFNNEVKKIQELAKKGELTVETLNWKLLNVKANPTKNNNNWWWWGGGWGKNSKAVKSLKEQLEEMRNLELQAIQDSELSQEEKYKKYMEIYDSYKDKIIEAEWKTYDEMYSKYKEYFDKKEEKIEKEYKYYQDLEKVQDKIDDSIEKHTKNVEKLWDEWNNVKKKATDSLREVNNQLKELDKDYASDMWERYVKVEDSIKEFQRKYWNAEWLKWYSVDMLKDWGSDEISWIKVDDAIEYIQLLEEQEYLNKHITQEIKDQVDEIKNVSEAEQILYEYEQKRNTLLERRKILEAVSNSWNRDEEAKVRYKDLNKETVEYFDEEEQQWKDITDFKNEEYAREVLDNQEKLQQKKEDLDNALQDELKAYGDQVLKIKDEYSKDTKNYTDELDKKKKAFANYVKDMNELASQLSSSVPHNAYWWSVLNGRASWVWENWPEQIIARQSSYVQPRNAINNNSTVYNNQSSLNINWIEVWNFNTIDDLLNELKNRLTYRN